MHRACSSREAVASKNAMLEAYPDMTIKRFKEAMVFSPQALEDISANLRNLGIPEE